MKIEKLPSGSYRIRKMYKGITYTVITEYKPTQKEALQLLSAEMDKIQYSKEHMSFEAAAKKFMDIKNSKYFMAIKSYFQPEKSIKSAFMLCAVQSRKG